jgi:ABC-2 type transport system permease protein
LNIDPKRIDSIRSQARETKIDPVRVVEGNELKKSNSGVSFIVGYASAFLIYITLFIYGTMVMRGVMEEKTNRIAEVVVSSVRPYQLMMGKITGIGAVGLTQFFIWIILITGLITLAGAFVPPDVLQQVQDAQAQMPGQGQQISQFAQTYAKTQVELSSVNWGLILFCFIFYFIGGYLFYAALFAAVGSSVNEDPQDAQSLLLPITMPIIFAIIIMINSISNPDNSLAIWSSMIPFFSPIVMMSRIPFGVPGTVPWWQLGLSMALLVGGFLFTTWVAAKIYRTGILLYGKKPTWKEMIKWAFRKN